MAPQGKPVTVTRVATDAYTGPDPKPLKIVGNLPTAGYPETALTAVPASFADEAAVRTYLATLVAELKSSPYFS